MNKRQIISFVCTLLPIVAPERLPSIPSIGMCVKWIIWLGNALLYTNIKRRQFVIGRPIQNSLWYVPSTYTLLFKEYGL